MMGRERKGGSRGNTEAIPSLAWAPGNLSALVQSRNVDPCPCTVWQLIQMTAVTGPALTAVLLWIGSVHGISLSNGSLRKCSNRLCFQYTYYYLKNPQPASKASRSIYIAWRKVFKPFSAFRSDSFMYGKKNIIYCRPAYFHTALIIISLSDFQVINLLKYWS